MIREPQRTYRSAKGLSKYGVKTVNEVKVKTQVFVIKKSSSKPFESQSHPFNETFTFRKNSLSISLSGAMMLGAVKNEGYKVHQILFTS